MTSWIRLRYNREDMATLLQGALDRARELLERAEAEGFSLNEIEQRTTLQRAWLSRFKRGEIPNPGILTVQSVISQLETLFPKS